MLECLILKIIVSLAELSFIKKKKLNEFCLEIRTEFLTISEMALNMLLPFCTVCLRKVVMSTLSIIKSKYHPALKDGEDSPYSTVQ